MGPLLLPLLLLLMTTRAVCGMGGMGSEDLRAAQQNMDTAVENAKEAVKHDEMVDQEKKDSGKQ
ncbi:hypothetical protein DPMN_061947 [Dreissena polymorpha]|uniref:Uncharacterized protein n=1 Tax=Dreissena polymorpha TaxID=45954 RepID=A0A9D4C8P3_DREPO|nr:hypothetical protein DPMN_061947 [Dreissena polymorpha]